MNSAHPKMYDTLSPLKPSDTNTPRTSKPVRKTPNPNTPGNAPESVKEAEKLFEKPIDLGAVAVDAAPPHMAFRV